MPDPTAQGSFVSTIDWNKGLVVAKRIVGCVMAFHFGAKTKHVNPAAERNKGPILDILKKYILRPESSTKEGSIKLLEISSGSGQHVAHIAPHFPWVTIQPSEIDESSMGSIFAYVEESRSKNIKSPIYLDVTQPFHVWDGGRITEGSQDYILNINLIHISPYACTEGLFANSGAILRPGGILFTYGPYAFDGKIFPESNVRFDASLRQENREWGLKDVRDLTKLAAKVNMKLENTHAMPANNHVLVWRKQ